MIVPIGRKRTAPASTVSKTRPHAHGVVATRSVVGFSAPRSIASRVSSFHSANTRGAIAHRVERFLRQTLLVLILARATHDVLFQGEKSPT